MVVAQATVGTLVAKILTSSTSNPYAAAGQAARAATPTALDAFSVQVSPSPRVSSHSMGVHPRYRMSVFQVLVTKEVGLFISWSAEQLQIAMIRYVWTADV
jgi:hypothetical protein